MANKNDDQVFIIPDTQMKPGVLNPLIAVAALICEVRPRYVIHGGDHWDMPSLSRYDKGKKSHRSKTYLKDIRAGNYAMEEFWLIIQILWPEYKEECTWVILEGNHENRINRAYEYGPDELVDLMMEFQRDYSEWDKVLPFLEEYTIKGITFSHYFLQDNSNGAISTAAALINKRHASCIAFHKQGFDYKEALSTNGRRVQCMIAGSCYYHDESYKAHTNHHWRGVVILKNIKKGMYDFERFSLESIS